MKMDKLKKFAPLLLLIALGATLAIANYENNLVNFVYDLADIQEIDRRITGEFFLENLPEFFNASVHIQGSGYVGQNHEVSVEISHDRPDGSLWLASGNFSIGIESGGELIENITKGWFTRLNNTVPYVSPSHFWTPFSPNGTYDIFLNLNNLVWTRGYIIDSSAGTGGTIDPSGIICVVKGGMQGFTIESNIGYEISEITIDYEPWSTLFPEDPFDPYIQIYSFILVDSSHTITASFEQITYTITSSAPAGGGIISPYGIANVPHGDNQTYTISPNPGYVVDTIYIDTVPTVVPGDSYTFTNVQADHTIEAVFKLE